MKTYLTLLLLPLLLSLNACNSVDSQDIKTSGFYVSYSVTSTFANQNEVSAILSTSSSLTADYIDLNGGDTLVATTAGASKNLSRQSQGHYTTTFPTSSSQLFTVALERPNDPNAPNSSVTLPAPFIITAPTPNQTFASGVTINLNWNPVGSASNFYVSHDTTCTDTAGQSLTKYNTLSSTDTGTLIIQPSTLIPAGADPTKTCLVSLAISRQNTGSLDPAYKGGSIISSQSRSVSILLNP